MPAAQIVLQHGSAHTPYIGRLALELESARKTGSAARAKPSLERHTADGGESAMRAVHLRL